MHSFINNPSKATSLFPHHRQLDNSFCDIEEEYRINLRLLLVYKDLVDSKIDNSNKENKCIKKSSSGKFQSDNDDNEKHSNSSISSGFIADIANDYMNKIHLGRSATATNSSIDSISLSSDSNAVSSSSRLHYLNPQSELNNQNSIKNYNKILRRSTEISSPSKLKQVELEDRHKSVLLLKNQLAVNMNSGSEFCHSCEKRVYPFERTSTGNNTYHKSCFRCSVCNRTLLPGNFAALDGIIFCKPHYIEKFRIRGKYETQAKKPNDIIPVEKAVVE